MNAKLFFISVFVLGLSASLQGQLNGYKYIIVPKKFEVFKKDNQHQTSTMMKHFFTERGFRAVYEDALPEDLLVNRCLGLLVVLADTSSLFSTKVAVVLEDCRSNEIFRTVTGKSREKVYNVAYQKALTEAFASFDGMDYQYTPGEKPQQDSEPLILNFKNDIHSVGKSPKSSAIKPEGLSPHEREYNRKRPAPYVVQMQGSEEPPVPEWLYAQTAAHGFELMDEASQVWFTLVPTALEDVFLVDGGAKNGIVFQKEGQWFWEYVEQGEKKRRELTIQF